MAQFPSGAFFIPPPPPRELRRPSPPTPLSWLPPPSPPPNDSSQGGIITGIIIVFVAILAFALTWSFCKGSGDSRARAAASERGGDDERRHRSARLPAFTYSPSVKHNVTGGGGEEAAATCSVCLGAFQDGEAVRLLPVCLHLYHVDCIDPWLDAHSTCPLCRSDTDPTADVAPPPPV